MARVPKQQISLPNDEVLAAFSDWRSQSKCATKGDHFLDDEMIEAELAVIREFVEFIGPKLLAKCTAADLDAFSRQNTLNTGKTIYTRYSIRSAVISFRDFRKIVIKKQPVEKPIDFRLIRRRHIIFKGGN
jgi:hypothetical protein